MLCRFDSCASLYDDLERSVVAVYIVCPVCSVSVLVLPGGRVAAHGRRKLCSYTKTASSDGAPEIGSRKKNRRRRQTISKAVAAPAPDEPAAPRLAKSYCIGCMSKLRHDIGGGPLPAHMTKSGAWCSVGERPTESQMRAAEVTAAKRAAKEESDALKRKSKVVRKKRGKGSVWTVSGGLPGLGRR